MLVILLNFQSTAQSNLNHLSSFVNYSQVSSIQLPVTYGYMKPQCQTGASYINEHVHHWSLSLLSSKTSYICERH